MKALTGRKINDSGFGLFGSGSFVKSISVGSAKSPQLNVTSKIEKKIERFIEFVFLSLNNFN